MREKGLPIVSQCPCCFHKENVSHLFLQGVATRGVWEYFLAQFNISLPNTTYLQHMFRAGRSSSPFVGHGGIRLLIPTFILWFIWEIWNEVKHNHGRFTTNKIIRRVREYIGLLYHAHRLRFEQWRSKLDVAQAWGIFFIQPRLSKPKVVRWVPPDMGWYKLNTIGAANGNLGIASAGDLFWDHRRG
ncbi:hypothetical protein Salat_2602600 [Sesamum alatum]|uniref:Uncharacterized protein n=1 Tax=Sesamum alatum TaxID=300844 RepID=A0AAE1XN69_9LAMI|nr:hypothetical protein Salat_2602600 [Sesamum alatum]